jgi:hypothetical protein
MSDRPTPETDAFLASGKAHYMAGEFARRLERERDEARQAVAKLHDWLSVANNWLTECRTIYGETYAWPVNNDDLDQIPTILKDLDHLIP